MNMGIPGMTMGGAPGGSGGSGGPHMVGMPPPTAGGATSSGPGGQDPLNALTNLTKQNMGPGGQVPGQMQPGE